MTSSKMIERLAHQVVRLLNGYGIATSVKPYTAFPIDCVLRSSWYVDRAKQFGITDCIHIDVPGLGFLAVCNDGRIMSGCNCMTVDFFLMFYTEHGKNSSDEMYIYQKYGIRCIGREWDPDDGLFLTDFHNFYRFVTGEYVEQKEQEQSYIF